MPSTISLAQARQWLLLHLSGVSFRKIAKRVGHDREVIAKHVRKLEELMAVNEHLLEEVVPLAIKVYKAALEKQLADLEAGKQVDLQIAERILTQMQVLEPACD